MTPHDKAIADILTNAKGIEDTSSGANAASAYCIRVDLEIIRSRLEAAEKVIAWFGDTDNYVDKNGYTEFKLMREKAREFLGEKE